jgi:probable rRNA maturation factor
MHRRRPRSLKLSIAADLGRAFVPYLMRHLRAAHAILDPPLRELSMALVNDQRMAELHERFMGIDGPTDVMSFPLELDGHKRAITGEVAICVPEARRRAREHGTETKNELLLYALHGMLHLCGFDDRTDRGFDRMHRAEDMILTQLGVGPVFQHRSSAASAAVARKTRRRTKSS